MRQKKERLEWYLINNLKVYCDSLKNAISTQEIKNAAEKLDMFCVESMDWNTSLFKRCTILTTNAFKFVKNNQQ